MFRGVDLRNRNIGVGTRSRRIEHTQAESRCEQALERRIKLALLNQPVVYRLHQGDVFLAAGIIGTGADGSTEACSMSAANLCPVATSSTAPQSEKTTARKFPVVAQGLAKQISELAEAGSPLTAL